MHDRFCKQGAQARQGRVRTGIGLEIGDIGRAVRSAAELCAYPRLCPLYLLRYRQLRALCKSASAAGTENATAGAGRPVPVGAGRAR